jgi:alkylated DNA repair dioxygenase AlkB
MQALAAEIAPEFGGHYLPGFLSRREADKLFDALLARVQWRTERIVLFGRSVAVPRLVAWCGDPGINYRYSGADHPCAGWIDELAMLRERLAAAHGFPSALVLLNRYRDGADGMGWHTDDERGHGPWIASVTLGAPRRFLVRPLPGRPAVGLTLEHGSLLFMRGTLPHALPKTRRPTGERVNLTFRTWTGSSDA